MMIMALPILQFNFMHHQSFEKLMIDPLSKELFSVL